jgi:hypothetical protein
MKTLRITGFPVQIRTEHLPNTNLERYPQTKLFIVTSCYGADRYEVSVEIFATIFSVGEKMCTAWGRGKIEVWRFGDWILSPKSRV